MSFPRDQTPPLIYTKLQQPQLDTDLIVRPHLIDKLNRGLGRRLILISAQAGAGKTTLLAQWLNECSLPCAWVSLDKHDNDLIIFVSYLCAAIQSAIPGACAQVLGLLNAPAIPPTRIMMTTLVNDLHALSGRIGATDSSRRPASDFILALDDYHTITDREVHQFVADLIAYLPRHFHLALTSRTDPPLPLARLRSRKEMIELRTSDLRFTRPEVETLLAATVGRELDSTTIDSLEQYTEGWAVGLRLAWLSLRHAPDDQAFVRWFNASSSSTVVDYLATEVLARQSPAHQDFLLHTSILDRLEAGLCDAVLVAGATDDRPATSHVSLHELVTANLFLASLDSEGRWFRYHHLFRDVLYDRLQRERSAEEISALHHRASQWFVDNGLIDEALTHAFAAGDLGYAAQLVAGQRYTLMNQARWQQLNRYLHRFPPEFADRQPELLMLQLWLLYHQGHNDKLPATVRKLETILSETNLPTAAIRRLQGEASALRSLLAYYQTDSARTVSEAESSIENAPPELWIVRILARVFLAGALQMRGDAKSAQDVIFRGADEESVEGNPFRATVLLSTCSLYWVIADLESLAQAASRCIELCDRPHSAEIAGYAHYHLGCVHYQRNELEAAEKHFEVVSRHPYVNYSQPFVGSVFGLAMTYEAQGRHDNARAMAATAVAHMLETGNTTLLAATQAFQAELALRQGQLAPAARWASQFDATLPLAPMVTAYRPALTLAKVWINQQTPACRQQAAELLNRLEAYSTFTHNTSVHIEVLALQALRYAAEANDTTALTELAKAIALAEPGGLVRLFVDLGPPLARLLHALHGPQIPSAYIDRILAAFPDPAVTHEMAGENAARQISSPLAEPLTLREIEVLALLADRLTNKEIANALVISSGTVKSHTLKIYAKLNVHGRRQAVDKAKTLGLLA